MNIKTKIIKATFIGVFLFAGASCKSWGLYDMLHNITTLAPPTTTVTTPTGLTGLNLTGLVSTYAGTPYVSGNINGLTLSKAATFSNPTGIVAVGTFFYVTDKSNNTIRRIDASGNVITFAGGNNFPFGIPGAGSADGIGEAASFNGPFGITSDGTSLYVTDFTSHTIRKIDIATRNVTTLAGFALSPGYTDGIGSVARFSNPAGITFLGGFLYIADSSNCTIRSIDLVTGNVTRYAGGKGAIPPTVPGCDGVGTVTNGNGIMAGFSAPIGITNDGSNLYISDMSSHVIRMMNITTTTVSLFAGGGASCPGTCVSGATDGAVGIATFNAPQGITMSGANIYVADTGNQTIRYISGGNVLISAGGVGGAGTTDAATNFSLFHTPIGMTFVAPYLYIADSVNNRIRKLDTSLATVSTLTGAPNGNASVLSSFSDGVASGAALFYSPTGIIETGGIFYVSDFSNSMIRKIDSSGNITTVVSGIGAYGIATDGNFLYVPNPTINTILKYDTTSFGAITVAGTGVAGYSDSTNGTGTTAKFNGPQGIATDGTNLYVTDTANNVVRMIVIATGQTTTLAGSPAMLNWVDGTGSTAGFFSPKGITTDGTNLYVVDFGHNAIRKIVIATKEVTTLAGKCSAGVCTSGFSDSTDGTGATASFFNPIGITSDGVNLYVSDSNYGLIRKIVIATGETTTLAGGSGYPAGIPTGSILDGLQTAAGFSSPQGLVISGGSLYVTDTNNYTIRKID